MPIDNGDNVPCRWADCDKIFNTKENLVSHVALKHLTKDAHNCLWEGCENYQLSNLNKELSIDHIKAHLRLALFICNYKGCKRNYKRFDAFLKHYHSHLLEDVHQSSPVNIDNEQAPEGAVSIFKSKRNLEKQLKDSINNTAKSKRSHQEMESIEELHKAEKTKSFSRKELDKKLRMFSNTMESNEYADVNIEAEDQPLGDVDTSQFNKENSREGSKGVDSVSISESEQGDSNNVDIDSASASDISNDSDNDKDKLSVHEKVSIILQEESSIKSPRLHSTKKAKVDTVFKRPGTVPEREKDYGYAAQVLEARIAIALENINYNEMCLYKAIKKKERLQVENKILVDSILKQNR